ncbi:MAG: GAF domain-containing SpoIIE family protein phosphatase [Pirellulaceae bacterium]
MTRSIPGYLRLHGGAETLSGLPDDINQVPGFRQVAHSLAKLTGWRLCESGAERQDAAHESASNSISIPCEHPWRELMLCPVAADAKSASLPVLSAETRELAAGIAQVLSEVDRLRMALRDREAELATNIPLTVRQDEATLATRLQQSLKAAAEVVGAEAASLYLLDDATEHLKLRATFNLPAERLLELPRRLDKSLADLEALAGHAVVLEDTTLLPHWSCPEAVPSAVCIPVSTSTTPLGTLWVYSKRERDFTAQETNMLEIIAGRLAVELERSLLADDRLRTDDLRQQANQAAERQRSQLPNVKPLVEGWDVAAWTEQGENLGGDFHDWGVVESGRLAIFVGDAAGRQFEAALTANSLVTAVKSNYRFPHTPDSLIDRVNHAFWSTSAGDHFASLAYLMIDPQLGTLEAASCGHIQGFLLQQNAVRGIWPGSWPLGGSPEVRPELAQAMLQPGDAVALVSSGLVETLKAADGENWQRGFCDLMVRHLELPTERMIAALREHLARQERLLPEDRTIMIVKRRPRE